jgi:hypothetical protein
MAKNRGAAISTINSSLAEEAKQSYIQAESQIVIISKFKLPNLNLSGLKFLETLPPQVAELHWLTQIDITNTLIRDISPIASLLQLQVISAKNSKIQDLNPLKALAELKYISIDRTPIVSLRPLANLQKLQVLSMRRSQIRNLDGIQGLKSLRAIDAYWTNIRDLTPLTGLPSLKFLNIQRTRIIDLTPLSSINELVDLDAYWTNVNSIKPLAKLTKLQHLNVARTNVDDLTPLAEVTSLSDAAVENRWAVGLQCFTTPAWSKLKKSEITSTGAFGTIELINLFRSKVGLNPYFPKGYKPPLEGKTETKSKTDPEQLNQKPASYYFEIDDGKLSASPQMLHVKHPEIAADIHFYVLEKSKSVLVRFQQSNAPRQIQNSLKLLIETLGDDVTKVRPGALLMRFRSLEADISAFDTEEARRELPEDAISQIRDTATSVEDLMGCFPELSDLEAERLAQKLQDADITSIVEHLEQILDAASDAKTAVADSSIEALDFANDIISELTRTIVNPILSDDTAAAIKAALF